MKIKLQQHRCLCMEAIYKEPKKKRVLIEVNMNITEIFIYDLMED